MTGLFSKLKRPSSGEQEPLTPRKIAQLIPEFALQERSPSFLRDERAIAEDKLFFTVIAMSYVMSAAAELNEAAFAEVLDRFHEERPHSAFEYRLGAEDAEAFIASFQVFKKKPPSDRKDVLELSAKLFQEAAASDPILVERLKLKAKAFQNLLKKNVASGDKRKKS